MKRFALWLIVVLMLPGARALAEDHCVDSCSTRPTDGILSCYRKCNMFQTIELPVGFDFLPKFLDERSEAPDVRTVKIDPIHPATGSPANVTVKMPRSNSVEKAQNYEFEIYTSTESLFSWQVRSMRYDPVGELWEAELDDIPATPTLYFFLRGFNNFDDVYVELPCPTSRFPFGAEDCTVPLAEDESYVDTEDFHVDPAYDLTTSRVGADDKYLYFSLDIAAAPKPGRRGGYMTLYFMGINNLDRKTRIDALTSVTYLVYAPTLFAPEDCKAMFFAGGQWMTESSPVDCKVRDKSVFFRVDRGVLGKMPNNAFSVFRGVSTMLNNETSIIHDFSPITVVRVGARRIDYDVSAGR